MIMSQKYDFKLTTGDKNVGTVYLPDDYSGKIPVIVYSHGWGGNRSYGDVLQKLFPAKMAWVTFDYYGCGETGGDYSQMTYRRWKENLSDVITWVSEQPFADMNKLGCYAISSGTTSALRLASEDSKIKYMISVATCISAHIGMGSGGPAKLLADNLESLRSGGTAQIFGVDFPLDFYTDTVSNAPIQKHIMENIKCPILFLQGGFDNVFRRTDAKMAYDLLRYDNVPVKHIEIEKGNHGLDNVADEAAKVTMDWLLDIGMVVSSRL